MSQKYIGLLPFAQLSAKKRQRPKGGSKNVYYFGVQRGFYNTDPDVITSMLRNFGGISAGTPNNYIFTKRTNAEKAWAWFLLRYS